MSKRITITLTEDQARAIVSALQNELQYDGDGDEATIEYNAFIQRIYRKIGEKLYKES